MRAWAVYVPSTDKFVERSSAREMGGCGGILGFFVSGFLVPCEFEGGTHHPDTNVMKINIDDIERQASLLASAKVLGLCRN